MYRSTRTGALLCTALLAVSACGENYSNGERAGVVTKLSEKGLIFKSWEGELLVALPIGVAGTTQPEKFPFNVAPEAVAQVKAAAFSGKRTVLTYRQWAIAPLTIDHGHVVVAARHTE